MLRTDTCFSASKYALPVGTHCGPGRKALQLGFGVSLHRLGRAKGFILGKEISCRLGATALNMSNLGMGRRSSVAVQ